MSDCLAERVTLDLEFLRRALGNGREGDPADVVVTPGTLPPDLPVTLPEWAGLRVLGGVRAAAPRWTFSYPRSTPQQSPEYLMWRVFLDVPLPLDDVRRALTDGLMHQGWRPGQMQRRAIVEAERGQWLAVHAAQGRTLTLALREADGVTQVWLGMQDTDQRQLEHLQGLNVTTADEVSPLPTLTVPAGARTHWQGDGDLRQEAVIVEGSDPGTLLAQFATQLELQEGPLLHRRAAEHRAELLVQGRDGLVLLSLESVPGGVRVHLLKVAATGEVSA